MRTPLIFLLLLFLALSARGQPEIQVMGTDRPETGQQMVWHNGAFYLLLQIQSEVGGENAGLLRLDTNGSPVWARALGTPGRDLVNSLAAHQDGVLALGRMVEPGDPNVIDDVYLHFFQPNGNIGWSRYFGRTTGGDDEHAAAVFTTEDGNIVVAMHEAVGGDRPAYLALLEADGETVWGTQLRHDALDWIFPAHGIARAGKIWLAGAASPANGTEEAFWTILNSAGQPMSWYSMTGGNNQPSSFRHIIPLEDGCLMVGTVGAESPDLLLVWTDDTGSLVMAKRFHDPSGASLLAASGGYERADGRIVVAANRFEETGAVSGDGLWLLLEADGTLAAARRIGQGREVFRQLISGPGGTVAAIGSTFSPNSNAGDVAFLQWPEDWWSAPETCLSVPWLPEPAALVWNSRSGGAFTTPWLAETDHQMVDVPFTIDARAPLCCPEQDTLYASICAGRSFEGFTAAGMHHYQVDSLGSCGLSRVLFLEVADTSAIISVEVQPSDCEARNGSVRINAQGDSLRYSLAGEGFQNAPVFKGLPTGIYSAVVELPNGCISTMDSVVVAADCPVYLPNAFSPNGDGRNDVLQLYTSLAEAAEVISFQVFDRYGGLLFEASGDLASVQWDGRVDGQIVNPGVYTCVGRVRLPLREVEIAQSVTVIR